MSVHIYAPPVTYWRLIEHDCPTCRMITQFLTEGWEWQPAHHTCLSCGDSWSDGERIERPFARGWRQKEITAARKRLMQYMEAMK